MKSYIFIIGVLIAVISGLITLNVFFQQSLQMEMAEQFNKQQLLLSTSIASNIQGYLYFIKEDVLHLSKMLSKADLGDKQTFNWLTSDTIIKKTITKADVGIINTDGNLVYFEGDKTELKKAAPYILKHAKSNGNGSAVIVEYPPAIYVLSPISDKGSMKGAIFISLAIGDIAKYFVSDIKSGSRGYAWMMDKEGTLLYHPTQPGMMGGNIYKADSACFKCHINFDLEKKVVEGKAENYGRHIAPSGEDKIIAFSTVSIDDISWIIAVSAPYSEVTSATKRSMELYSYLIISIFITTSIVSTLLIVFNKKRIKAEEVAKRKEELEKYAVELEERVNERTKELMHAEKLASIGRLAAGIAHEIGNPLTSIFSFVQILREMEDDEFKKESLETIYFHINRISEILKQLSGFSKMPVGEPKECRINEIIETSINLIQYDKKAKDISIVKNLSPDLPVVTVDGNQLSQVFVNLTLNAIDAMPEGGTLTVRSMAIGNEIIIQFQDTGTGIPREDLPKIFDPFYTTKEKGTGLGLAVSYNIIKKMNGTLTTESEAGKGSTFTISLPATTP